MPIKSIATIVLFYFFNGPFCDLLEALKLSSEWIGFIDYSILFVSLSILNFSTLKNEYKAFKIQEKSLGKFLLEAIGIMVVAYILVNLLVSLCHYFGLDILPQNTENLKENSAQLPKFLTFLMMVVYAPFIEELTFRHSMIAWPGKNNEKIIRFMALVSIVAFDLIHVIHIEEFLYYLPLSIALTYIYLHNDRKLLSSIIAHSLTNLVGFFLILVGGL